jgi:uncharacterized protein (DUF433 family)
MKVAEQADCLKLNAAGLAVVSEIGVLAGDLLILTLMYGVRVAKLLDAYPGLTSEMIDAVFAYAAEHPETPEGLFYFSEDIAPLLAATGVH